MMERELWLGREKHKAGWYGIYQGEPTSAGLARITGFERMGLEESQTGRHGLIDCFCPEIFHAIIPKPARLRKGRKKRIKSMVIELEG